MSAIFDNCHIDQAAQPHFKYIVRLQLLDDMLGTVPKNKQIYSNFIASKIRDLEERGIPLADGREPTPQLTQLLEREEVESVAEMEERGYTGFHTDNDGIFVYDYMLRGFLAEAARVTKEFGQLKQLNSKVKQGLFVYPRRIRMGAAPDDTLERPLRAMTAQGPRVALVKSDTIKAGREFEIGLVSVKSVGITQNCIRALLQYGALQGLGQWRTGGWGRIKVLSIVVHESPARREGEGEDEDDGRAGESGGGRRGKK